jgi:2',3'-cyclic-nucleotide 2'-phosphodiesterase (5'-nucleotidase family)
LAHVGLYCRGDQNDIKLEYKIRDINTIQAGCRNTDEAYKLLKNLNTDIINVFFAGHKHDVTHNWINDIPVMSNDRNGKYAQIIYLPFDRRTKKLVNNKIIIEGPLPICEKIFKNKKICDLAVINENDEKQFGDLVSYTFHGEKISKELSISQIGEKYKNIFNKYDKDILTHTYDHFESFKEFENNLGNFYCEFLRQISGADISIVNPGGFRTPLYRGNISNATIHSFDPFGNKLVKFYAFGWEIKKIIKNLQKGSKGFYPTSGLKMTVKNFPAKRLLKVKLFDGVNEKEIENDKYYSIVSSAFCFPIEDNSKGGDDFRKVYEWFKPRNPEYIQIGNDKLSRDILINFLRNINELEENIFYNKDDVKMRIVE